MSFIENALLLVKGYIKRCCTPGRAPTFYIATGDQPVPCTEADNGQHLDLVVHTLESIGQVNSEVSALQLGPMAWGLMSDQHRLACIRRIFAKLFENQPFFLTDFLDSHPIMTAKELVVAIEASDFVTKGILRDTLEEFSRETRAIGRDSQRLSAKVYSVIDT